MSGQSSKQAHDGGWASQVCPYILHSFIPMVPAASRCHCSFPTLFIHRHCFAAFIARHQALLGTTSSSANASGVAQNRCRIFKKFSKVQALGHARAD